MRLTIIKADWTFGFGSPEKARLRASVTQPITSLGVTTPDMAAYGSTPSLHSCALSALKYCLGQGTGTVESTIPASDNIYELFLQTLSSVAIP